MEQEDKAKAYDKVRKKIAIRFGSNIANEFFAEFEESEDEKVRKEIINYFQCQSEEEPTRKEIHNKWIAWLENIPYTIDHEKREGFHLGYKACLEKRGEQNFEMKTAAESLGISSDEYNKIVDECLFGEQKPQRMISAEAKEAMYDKPAAWSEEDSFRTETLISVIKSGGSIRPELRNEYVNWLKSLRPQNRWKPSDEQIKVCKEVYADLLSAKGFDLGTVVSELNRLEEGLKKKGE